MVFESLTVSGDGWKSSGWELTPDSLRADAPSVSRAQLSLHGFSPLGWPLNCCSPFLLCVAAFLAMANRWQCCLCHEMELTAPTAGQVSCPHSGLMSSIREHLAPGVKVTSHQGPTESKAGRRESRNPIGASLMGTGRCPLLF